ncbi:GNAT family N-acetyltransferase [Siphonobacter sp. SORGH_AS_0500]|uniref:GNAT family N-acetyltransferase n=1 Tax=Siphonobacter sp. SORGH_AS_0500 TaxID=1864824 RepID=UPI00286138AA|nr:GNAT family N-acetyltransferase [Siphonobacter sp. SORGH_AS_0500]MDR6195150.1 ribosomal protein S18 acetylase RimI-like enzyme [Siphonobacter sp. SORGH_AS_0500]
MLQISLAQPADIPVIQDIAFTAWKPTYGHILSEEQSRFMLDWMYSSETLHQTMEGHTVFLLAKEENIAMGFAAFEPKEGGIVKLHKIYFLPISQGRGYGRQLLDEVSKQAVQAGGRYLELNVNRSNSARQFYEKLGFEMVREEDNYIGNGYWMNDYVMRKNLL